MYPTLFISHGAPNIILGNSFSKKNINKFSKTLDKPKYIIIFSAHYLTNDLKILDYEKPELLYDFYGFEKELYDYEYEINSNEEISLKVMKHLNNHNLNASIHKGKNSFDHGVWTTLSMMYKNIDIPVVQISLPKSYSYEQLITLGEALKDLKNEAMIIASGGLTHNLSDISPNPKVKKYAKDFNDYVCDAITNGSKEKLLRSTQEPMFYMNHPTAEHFLPLFIAFGSAFNKKGISFNSEIVYSNISMECFAFDLKD
ncbi:DODA-type extradiol aromatic ring-opening family dioxygenase [Arcobacter sp. YIC-464]|uniref:DODA-type extradiol aromatic ring-opening family dioxygenase n=1 Tax=Arcobacter sp. YIC-464 TaxID=3376631 RepID=UPI003C1C6A69